MWLMWFAYLGLFYVGVLMLFIVQQIWAAQEDIKEMREHPYRFNKHTGRRW